MLHLEYGQSYTDAMLPFVKAKIASKYTALHTIDATNQLQPPLGHLSHVSKVAHQKKVAHHNQENILQ